MINAKKTYINRLAEIAVLLMSIPITIFVAFLAYFFDMKFDIFLASLLVYTVIIFIGMGVYLVSPRKIEINPKYLKIVYPTKHKSLHSIDIGHIKENMIIINWRDIQKIKNSRWGKYRYLTLKDGSMTLLNSIQYRIISEIIWYWKHLTGEKDEY